MKTNTSKGGTEAEANAIDKAFESIEKLDTKKLKICLQQIKEQGEDTDSTRNGKTLLQAALSHRGKEKYNEIYNMVELLLEAKVNPNTVDENGNSALTYAISKSKDANSIIGMLLDYRANPEAKAGKNISVQLGYDDSPKKLLVFALLHPKFSEQESLTLMTLLCEKGAQISSLYDFLEGAKKHISGGVTGGGDGGIAGGTAGGGNKGKISQKLSEKLSSLSKILPALEEKYPEQKKYCDLQGALRVICHKDNIRSNPDRPVQSPLEQPSTQPLVRSNPDRPVQSPLGQPSTQPLGVFVADSLKRQTLASIEQSKQLSKLTEKVSGIEKEVSSMRKGLSDIQQALSDLGANLRVSLGSLLTTQLNHSRVSHLNGLAIYGVAQHLQLQEPINQTRENTEGDSSAGSGSGSKRKGEGEPGGAAFKAIRVQDTNTPATSQGEVRLSPSGSMQNPTSKQLEGNNDRSKG